MINGPNKKPDCAAVGSLSSQTFLSRGNKDLEADGNTGAEPQFIVAIDCRESDF